MGLELCFTDIIYHFRYIGLFLLLTCGMIGVPVPDEILMTFSGFQVSLGRMEFVLTLFVATLGSFLGMNLSYWIGRLIGPSLLQKIAPMFHLSEKRINQTEQWFLRFGDYLILIGYYIPGVRHLTAYFSGMSKLHYGRYVTFAGIGAFLWALTFISLGRVLGEHWHTIAAISRRYVVLACVVLAVVLLTAYLYNLKKTVSFEKSGR